jgi:LPXTG-site transpeptidase (sortase) family protein
MKFIAFKIIQRVLSILVVTAVMLAVVPVRSANAATYTLTISSGSPQSAPLNTSFALPLRVRVTGALGVGINGSTVTFTVVPVGGAGAVLSSTTAVTSGTIPNRGYASVNATANGIAGAYTVTAQVTGGNTSNTVTFLLTNGNPNVLSITRAGVSPTNAVSVDFNVAISWPVSVPVASDFTLTTTGDQGGASVTGISPVSGFNGVYTVSVATVAGAGTIRLDVSDSDNSIVDAFGYPLGNPNFTSGQSYTIDRIPPAVTSISRLTANPTELGTVSFVVAFNEQVTGVDNSDFSLATTGGQGDAAITGTPVCLGSPTTCWVFVSTGSGNGNLGLDLISSPTIQDSVGNPLSGPFTDEVYTVLRVAPTVDSIMRKDADPTGAASVTFTVLFSNPVDGVDASDFTLTTTGAISSAGINVVTWIDDQTYEVTVSTGSGNGTIQLDLVDNDSIRDFANPIAHFLGGLGSGNGNHTGDQYYTIDKDAPTVTITSSATDPTAFSPIPVTITFSKPVSDFVVGDLTVGNGTAGNLLGSGAAYTADITPTSSGTVTADIYASVAYDSAGNWNLASETFSIVYDTTFPVVLFGTQTIPLDGSVLWPGPSQFSVEFSKDVLHDGSPDAADHVENYLLLQPGPNGIFDLVSCGVYEDGGNSTDDILIIPSGPAIYDNNGGNGPFIVTVIIQGGAALPEGTYRLLICGSGSIHDPAGNRLNDGEDSLVNFIVRQPVQVNAIPATGFAPNKSSSMPVQTAEYSSLGDLWLEIPSLGVSTPIVGVPQSNGSWDVSWLGNDTGWLNGTAYPTWKGNSVLTAHVYDSFGKPGPFAGINRLWYGSQIIVHAWGGEFVYEVRSVMQVDPTNSTAMMKHQDLPWLTLVTCRGYNVVTDSYKYRVLVRAVLVDVK